MSDKRASVFTLSADIAEDIAVAYRSAGERDAADGAQHVANVLRGRAQAAMLTRESGRSLEGGE